MASETAYKRAFRESYGGWTSAVEPGRGSDTGAADLLVLVGDHLVPVELKIAEPEYGVFHVKNPGIRPSQIAWHSTLWRSGGFSLFAFGIWRDKAWHTAFVHGHEVEKWRDGFDYFDDFRGDELKIELERLTACFFGQGQLDTKNSRNRVSGQRRTNQSLFNTKMNLRMTDEEIVAEMNRIRAFNRGQDSCLSGGPYETSIYRHGSTEYTAYQKGWLAYARRVVEANKGLDKP